MKDYISPLNIPEGKSGKYSIEHKVIPANSDITLISQRTALFTGQKSKNLRYDVPVKYTYLNNGGILMSDVPQEQIQHEPIIEKCSGRVLIGGLGIGYIATMLAQKSDIKDLVIVEISKDVIELVWPHLDLKNKGKIINQDLFEYLRQNAKKEKFDYVYFDIWSPDSESVLYEYVLPLRRLAKPYVKSGLRILCWNEDVMRGQLQLNLMTGCQFSYDQILTMDDITFNEIYGKWDKPEYPFWNWIRSLGIPKEYAMGEIEEYVKTIGSVKWSKRWFKWDKRLNTH